MHNGDEAAANSLIVLLIGHADPSFAEDLEQIMGEFVRSCTILLMGATVMGAGLMVMFYG